MLLRAAAPPPPAPLPEQSPDWGRGRPGRGRRLFAGLALVAMLLVAGGVLGNAGRGGLFAGRSTAPTLDQPSSSSSGASVVTPDDGTSSAGDVAAGLVNITTTFAGGEGRGAGSGMIVSRSGQVLTNNHVIEGSSSIRVEILSTGAAKTAKVIGYDIDDDVALLQIEDVSGLDTVPIGDPDTVSLNDPVLVLGNALGRGGDPTAAPGVVTGLGRQITATDSRGANAETLTDMIQVEADVQPGHSGGALVGPDGTVVGMTTAASARNFRFSVETSGVGFAIRIDKALSIVDMIRRGDERDGVHVGPRALLGVEIQDTSLLDRRSGGASAGGVAVTRVEPGTPADEAGIESGDTIVSIGGSRVTSSATLMEVMNRYHAGEKAEVVWIDGSGRQRRATVTFDEGPPA